MEFKLMLIESEIKRITEQVLSIKEITLTEAEEIKEFRGMVVDLQKVNSLYDDIMKKAKILFGLKKKNVEAKQFGKTKFNVISSIEAAIDHLDELLQRYDVPSITDIINVFNRLLATAKAEYNTVNR